MRLAQKIALVTGAGSGIGQGIARRFAAEGAFLVLSDMSEAGLQETAALIGEVGGQSISVVGDVSIRADAERIVAAAVQRWGRLDIVVNNAGISGSREATLAHLTPDEEWERVIAVNVNGVFRVASAAIRQMLTQGQGNIVNIASVAGFVPFPARAAYNASKGAVVSFTRALALDYAASHIRVNAICPGMVGKYRNYARRYWIGLPGVALVRRRISRRQRFTWLPTRLIMLPDICWSLTAAGWSNDAHLAVREEE